MLKKVILYFAAGTSAVILGLGIFYASQYLKTAFENLTPKATEVVNAEEIQPKEISIDELIYPKVPAKVQSEKQQSENDADDFDPTGDYFLIGGADKTFQNFDGFFIERMNFDEDLNTNRWIQESNIPKGYIYTEDGKELKFAQLFVTGKQIYFETVSKNGISYRFEGRFIEEKEIKSKDEIYYAFVEGYLIKLENGKETVRRVAHYGYVGGC